MPRHQAFHHYHYYYLVSWWHQVLLLSSHGEPADVLEPPLPLHRHYVPHCVEGRGSGHHPSHQPHQCHQRHWAKAGLWLAMHGGRDRVGPGYSSSDTFWSVFNVSALSSGQVLQSGKVLIFGVSQGLGVGAGATDPVIITKQCNGSLCSSEVRW